ncbi:MAG: hypothetical protein JSU57_04430 [Candidatus Heimdallarchaeota archaeon]|nr:MAG: hypothetical protein JSU57_04430 [Candidatus Heimdallarchaeota archaeon]
MPLKHIRCLSICIISVIILINVVSSSMIFSVQNSENDQYPSYKGKYASETDISSFEIKIKKVVLQDDITNTTTTPTNTTTTNTTAITTEETNTTDTAEFPPWDPHINIFGTDVYLFDTNLYYGLALIFSILGILSTLWLVFFVETSKDRTIRERIIGSAIRLVFMSLFLGLALHFWILFEPI